MREAGKAELDGATALGQPLRAHLDKKPISSADKRWDWVRRGAPIISKSARATRPPAM